jgi:hypothetical protein
LDGRLDDTSGERLVLSDRLDLDRGDRERAATNAPQRTPSSSAPPGGPTARMKLLEARTVDDVVLLRYAPRVRS